MNVIQLDHSRFKTEITVMEIFDGSALEKKDVSTITLEITLLFLPVHCKARV